jgi:HlyD family secretion protein
MALVAAAAMLLALVAASLLFWRSEEAPRGELVLYGNVDIRQVDVGFNDAGRVEHMLVEEGAAVHEGDLIAELDAARYRAEVNDAEAGVAARRATLQKLERGSRPQEIARTRADLAAAEAVLENARREEQRLATLRSQDVASKQAYDAARAAWLSAKGQRDAARETLALTVEGPRKEDIEAARASLHEAEAALALSREHLKDTKLYAPADGHILTRIVEPGAVVLANSAVYTIALGGEVWVRTYVGERSLGLVRPGMRAEITTDSFPGRIYPGWIGFISPEAEFTPKSVETTELRTSLVYRMRVYARDRDETLRQGMPVTVRIPLPAGSEAGPSPRDGRPPSPSGG